jgi:hypothetical protein
MPPAGAEVLKKDKNSIFAKKSGKINEQSAPLFCFIYRVSNLIQIMKQVNDLQFKSSHLRNAEHFQFHWTVCQFLEPLMPAIPRLAEPWNFYLEEFEKEDALYKRSTKSGETKEISRRDWKRDEDFKFIGRMATYESHSEDSTKQAAGERLEEVLTIYKGADRKALGENSALITNFLQDLEIAENKEAVQTLGLTAVVESLRTHNLAVEQLYNQRAEGLHLRHEEGRLAEQRLQVDKAYTILANAIDAIYLSNEYGDKNLELRARMERIIDGLNARIAQTSHVYARRTGRKLKGKSGGGSVTPGTPDTPAPLMPHLAMENQQLYGESVAMPGLWSWMSAEAVDASAFAELLNPAAQGGELRIYDGYSWESFPIEALTVTTDGGTVGGLVVGSPSPSVAFNTLSGEEAPAEVVKNGVILATLGGLRCPSLISEG